MLNGALQYCYLMKYDASFAESFYGLKRVTIDNEKLNDKQRWLCLITLTLLPYVQQKLQETISMYRLQKAEGSLKSVSRNNPRINPFYRFFFYRTSKNPSY